MEPRMTTASVSAESLRWAAAERPYPQRVQMHGVAGANSTSSMKMIIFHLFWRQGFASDYAERKPRWYGQEPGDRYWTLLYLLFDYLASNNHATPWGQRQFQGRTCLGEGHLVRWVPVD
ncbi:hypothetical protein FOPE_03807 [Fonsecaea pedrosoi]|nr:hypothetical protein FOPE_03807 [Fonsecaea pedrosoi]